MADFQRFLELDEGREWLKFEGNTEREWLRSTESCVLSDMV